MLRLLREGFRQAEIQKKTAAGWASNATTTPRSPPHRSLQEETQVHRPLIWGLSNRMSSCRAGGQCQSARRMLPPLCLLLLLLLPPLGATTALPLEGGLTSHDRDSGVSSLTRPHADPLSGCLFPCGFPTAEGACRTDGRAGLRSVPGSALCCADPTDP